VEIIRASQWLMRNTGRKVESRLKMLDTQASLMRTNARTAPWKQREDISR